MFAFNLVLQNQAFVIRNYKYLSNILEDEKKKKPEFEENFGIRLKLDLKPLGWVSMGESLLVQIEFSSREET